MIQIPSFATDHLHTQVLGRDCLPVIYRSEHLPLATKLLSTTHPDPPNSLRRLCAFGPHRSISTYRIPHLGARRRKRILKLLLNEAEKRKRIGIYLNRDGDDGGKGMGVLYTKTRPRYIAACLASWKRAANQALRRLVQHTYLAPVPSYLVFFKNHCLAF